MYDKLIYKDWLFWLLMFSFLPAIGMVQGEQEGNGLDVLFFFGFQFLFFGVLPTSIRKGWRSRRA